jgi:hypothetical protein
MILLICASLLSHLDLLRLRGLGPQQPVLGEPSPAHRAIFCPQEVLGLAPSFPHWLALHPTAFLYTRASGDATFAFSKALTNGSAVLLFPSSATAAFSTALALAVSALAISTFALLTSALLTPLSAPVAFAVFLPLLWCAVVASIGKSCLVAVEILLLVVAATAESVSKVHLYLFSDPLGAQSDLWLFSLQKIYSPICGQLILRTPGVEVERVDARKGVARTFSNTMSKISSSVNGLIFLQPPAISTSSISAL